MTDRTDQVVYLNNCELFVESLNFKQKGSYYLVWKKGKKNTQSNRYNVNSDNPITPKELLALSLKVYYKAGIPQPRHTHLILFNNSGQQLDRTKVFIHQWTVENTQFTVTLGGGTVKLKGKRRGIMKLQKFHRLRSQVQQTSQDQSSRFLKKISNKQSHTDKDEILRLSKEVEDLNFLVDKLKQQRNSGLVHIQKIETELSQVNDKMCKDLTKLRQYFSKKIEMRQSIYKEELQQLVTSFNRNHDLNISMMKNLIQEKFDYEEEIKELKESNQDFITKQAENFQNLIAQMDKHKQAVDEELEDSNEKLNEREATITQLNDQIDRLNEELEQLRNSYKTLQQNKDEEEERLNGIINELNIKLTENQGLIHEQTLMIERLTSENNLKEDQIASLTNIVAEHVKDKNELHAENMKLIDAREELTNSNQIVNMRNDQLTQELKELHTEVDKMRTEYEQLTSKYREDMQKRHREFTDDIQKQRLQNHQLNERISELFHEKQMESLKVTELEGIITQKDDEIQIYKKELEHNKTLAEELTKEMNDNVEKFKEHQNELTDKLGKYILKSNQMETENTHLKVEIQEVTMTSQAELMKMKDEYEILTESNKRLYEDELEMLRKTREEEEQYNAQIKEEYEREITSMMENHKNELEDLERTYREQSDKKDAEIYQAMQEKNNILEEFQAFKFKAQMDVANMQHELQMMEAGGGGKKGKKKMSEIEEVEEQIQEVESDEDEEEVVPTKKKQKTSKKAKIEEQQEEDQEVFEHQESEVIQQEESFSVFDMLKAKKKGGKQSPVKGKLKLKKDKEKEKVLSSLEFSRDGDSRELPQVLTSKNEQNSSDSIDKIRKKKTKKEEPHPKKQKEVNVDQYLQEIAECEQEITQLQAKVFQLQSKTYELESQNQLLKFDQETSKAKFERQQKKYQDNIKSQEDQIFGLHKEIQSLFNKLKSQDSKFAEDFQKELEKKKKDKEKEEQIRRKKQEEEDRKHREEEEQKKQQFEKELSDREPPSPKSMSRSMRKFSDHSKSRILREPPVDQEKYKKQIEELELALGQKERKVEILQQENKHLLMDIQRARGEIAEAQEKNSLLESKMSDSIKPPIPQPAFAAFGGESFMKESLANLEEKVSSEKQRFTQLKTKYDLMRKEYKQQATEFKKLKERNNQLQEQAQKKAAPRSMQDMQSELEDYNRKILELSKNLNQARLQRDSFEDELRLVRKKLAELSKNNQQNQSRALEAQRELQDYRRKQNKLKREIEQYQQDVKRLKETNRKSLQQLSEVRKSQSEFIIERKKVLDEVVRLEGVVAGKETEIVKLNKEIDKHKTKMNEHTDVKQGRERQYRTEMERLEIERSKLQRKIREQEQTIRVLNEKQEVLEKQAKKSNEQRKQTYSEKLKNYINQISTIKQIVDQYQQENTQLKLQNSQFFEQNEMLKTSFQKLQLKFQEQTEQLQHIQQELEATKVKIGELEAQAKKKASEEEKNKITITSLRKELDSERIVSRKRSQKLQQVEDINERCLYDIKTLKLRLNQYETNADDKQKLADQLFNSQRTIGSLEEELNKISEEYQLHTVKYVYTLEDVEKAIREIKEHEDKVKEEELSKIIQELDQNNSANRQNMEHELLTLYNQNEKLRVNLHKTNQDALALQLELAELQTLRERTKRDEKDKNILERRVAELTDELKSAREEVRRLQIKFNQSIRNQENKSTENVVMTQKYDDLLKRYQELTDTHLELKAESKKLLDKYKSINNQKDQTIEKLSNELQAQNNKLLSNELEITRLKEITEINNQDSFKSKKKLQTKIEEIQQQFRIKERDTELQFKTQVKDLKNSLIKCQEENDQRSRRIQELEEGVFMLQNEVEELTAELTDARSQLAEEGELYTLQINKLRNSMRENEQNYNNNLKNLEEELSAMSKELTTLKYARENLANSRLNVSRQSENCDDRGNRRYEEKLKLKDRRIEELKQTILVYEQRLVEVTRKSNQTEELDLLKNKLAITEEEWKAALQKKKQELIQSNTLCKQLSEQQITLKTRQQQLLLTLEEKELEINSVKAELSMVSKLYSDLQKELDKRKNNLNQQLEQQSSLKMDIEASRQELQLKNQRISQLSKQYEQTQAALKRKSLEIKQLQQTASKLEIQNTQLLSQQRSKLQGYNFAQLKVKEAQTQNQTLKSQIRKLRNQNSQQLKQNDQLKSQLQQQINHINALLQQTQHNDHIISEHQTLLNKYVSINQQYNNLFGINLQASVQHTAQLQQTLHEKEQDLIKTHGELQQLKFLLENKYLNHQQLKRQNYQLHIRDEERQHLLLTIEELEQQLIQTQTHNQELAFHLEAVKVQLSNIEDKINEETNINWQDIKNKLRQAVNDHYL